MFPRMEIAPVAFCADIRNHDAFNFGMCHLFEDFYRRAVKVKDHPNLASPGVAIVRASACVTFVFFSVSHG